MSERQIRNLFVLVLLGQIVFLSLQVPNPAKSGGLPERLGLALLAPIATGIDAGARGAAALRDDFRKRAGLVEQTRLQEAEIERLKLEILGLRDAEDETRRLAAALDYARAGGVTLHLADIVYVDYASWLRTLVVRVATSRAVANQPVVSSGRRRRQSDRGSPAPTPRCRSSPTARRASAPCSSAAGARESCAATAPAGW
jgi:cell shape-determining protein MreC